MRLAYFDLKSRDFLVFILLSYAIVISLFVDAGLRNYLVLFAAMLGGLLFAVFGLTLQRQAFWAIVVFSIMAMRTLFQGGVGDLGSVALTFVYSIGYFAIAGLLERVQDKRMFVQDMMRWIIYSFAILSVIQMVTSFAGLPIPNVMATKGLWSYNSLAYEPSQLGRVVGVTMLCYLMLARLPTASDYPGDAPQTLKKVLIAFLITMLLSGSSMAVVAIIIVFLLSRSILWVIALVTVVTLFWPMVMLIEYEPLKRASLLLYNLGSLDVSALVGADHSGAVRIIPAVIYINDLAPAELGFWIGYGNDGLTRFFLGRIPGLRENVTVSFLPGFMVIYGAISTALFIWVFVLRQMNRTTAPLIVFCMIFMASSAWNTQVFWYGLIVIQIAYAASRETAERLISEPS